MIICDLKGDLGDYLFQIFTTINYAIENNITFNFINYTGKKNHIYFDNIFRPLKQFIINQLPDNVFYSKELYYNYNRLNYLDALNILLIGNYHSYKYFINNYQQIYDYIKINDLKECVLKKYPNIHKYISIHFKYNSYKNIPIYVLLPYGYYKKTVQFMISKYNTNRLKFLLFYEQSDVQNISNIIITLKKEFCYCIFKEIPINITEQEQLIMMSLCRSNIISNSTFSWWGANLNTNVEKNICVPYMWYTNIKILHDLIPEKWEQIRF
jgi:hypothetical protein